MDRIDPARTGDERTMLAEFLDYHRATFLQKVGGLDKAQLALTLPPSPLTLAGLLKHLALVEDSWFQERFLGLAAPEPWASAPFDDDPDWELHSAIDDDPADLIAMYETACARSRQAFDDAPSLDSTAVALQPRTGASMSLRWIVIHMIEETARHNGHADLLREAIDGTTGD